MRRRAEAVGGACQVGSSGGELNDGLDDEGVGGASTKRTLLPVAILDDQRLFDATGHSI